MDRSETVDKPGTEIPLSWMHGSNHRCDIYHLRRRSVNLPKGCDRHEMLGSYSNEHAQIKESIETDQDKPPVKDSDRLLDWTGSYRTFN